MTLFVYFSYYYAIFCISSSISKFLQSSMLLLFKKLAKLPIGQLKEKCEAVTNHFSNKLPKLQQPKGEVIVKLCHSLIKLCENISEEAHIPSGFILLQYLQGLTMEVHQANRVEVYLIKIRTYLLTVKWLRMQKLPITKVLSRAELFLEQMKATPLYQAITCDFYSHVERLYLEVIQQKIHKNLLGDAVRLIGTCFESLKAQISSILSLFDPQDKKMQLLIERKVDLLEILFRYEHGVKMASGGVDLEQVASLILPKYDRITQKIPTIIFPSDSLLTDCENAWISNTKSIKNSISKREKSLSDSKHTSKQHFNQTNNQRHRDSIQQTTQYLDDFFRQRSHTEGQAELDRTPIKLPHAFNPIQNNNQKKSYFKKEKLQQLNQRTYSSEDRSKSAIKSMNQPQNQKRQKRTKCKSIIQPKKFKLVLEMDRQAREKMINLNPFSKMKPEQLTLLSKKRPGQLIVC